MKRRPISQMLKMAQYTADRANLGQSQDSILIPQLSDFEKRDPSTFVLERSQSDTTFNGNRLAEAKMLKLKSKFLGTKSRKTSIDSSSSSVCSSKDIMKSLTGSADQVMAVLETELKKYHIKAATFLEMPSAVPDGKKQRKMFTVCEEM